MSAVSHRGRRIRVGLLTASLTAGLAGFAAAPATALPTVPSGTVVAIGGAISPGEPYSTAIVQRIVDLAQAHAGAGNTPKIAVFTTASEVATNAAEAADWQNEDNATANGLYYANWFQAFGVDVYPVPIDVNAGEDYPGDPYSADNALDPSVAAEIASSDAVYFGGGDQINYVRALMGCTAADPADAAIFLFDTCSGTPAMAAIRSVVDSGGVSAGTSAGLTIQQGSDMITGGDPYPAWRDGAVPGWFEDDRLAYSPTGGFGFFSEGMLDSHFARRDRQPRIVKLALERQHTLAFGVEEKTAFVVDRATRTGEVIGELGVSLLDVGAASTDGTNAAGVVYSYLSSGSTIDFASGEMTLAGTPHNGPGTAAPPAAPTDIWGSYECDYGTFGTLHLAQGLVTSTASTAFGDSCDTPVESPRFRTTYHRTAATTWNDDGGFTNLEMSITRIPSFTASARLIGAAASGSLPVGSEADIEVTVTNTGGTPLGGISINGAAAAGAPASLAPNASAVLTIRRTVAAGPQTFTVEVGATALDTNGAELRVAAAPQTLSAQITGTPAPQQPTTPAPNGGSATPATQHGNATLARTGGPEFGWPLAIAGLLLAGAAGALAGTRRLARR